MTLNNTADALEQNSNILGLSELSRYPLTKIYDKWKRNDMAVSGRKKSAKE
jgi:hypothetical protein